MHTVYQPFEVYPLWLVVSWKMHKLWKWNTEAQLWYINSISLCILVACLVFQIKWSQIIIICCGYMFMCSSLTDEYWLCELDWFLLFLDHICVVHTISFFSVDPQKWNLTLKYLYQRVSMTCRMSGWGGTVCLQMGIPELRQHMETCGENATVGATFQFRPIKATSQPVPQ